MPDLRGLVLAGNVAARGPLSYFALKNSGPDKPLSSVNASG